MWVQNKYLYPQNNTMERIIKRSGRAKPHRNETLKIRCTGSLLKMLQIIRTESFFCQGMSDADIIHELVAEKCLKECDPSSLDKVHDLHEDVMNTLR